MMIGKRVLIGHYMFKTSPQECTHCTVAVVAGLHVWQTLPVVPHVALLLLPSCYWRLFTVLLMCCCVAGSVQCQHVVVGGC